MKTRAITVSQLNNYIKQVFDAEELLHGVEVVGDVDGIRQHGGAVYFTLKDAVSCIPCVCYFPAKMKCIENGNNVVVRGTVSYWHKAGKVSFVVTSCESFGFGALFLKFEELKAKLQAEGFFDAGVKKPLPSAVKRVGVVTSKTGAVLHDIAKVAHRRNPAVDIVLYPTNVQGSGAEAQIAEAIAFFSSGMCTVDVVIVARGGGSAEDLAPFNSERVARAVFTSKVPVVSAVGHETDWTLIDFISDLRAPTPSAAAEIVVAEALQCRDTVIRAYKHLRYTVNSKYESVISQIVSNYGKQKQAVLGGSRNRLLHTQKAYAVLRSGVQLQLQSLENTLTTHSSRIEANNPLAVLRRGYAKVFKGESEVASVSDVAKGDAINVRLCDGVVKAVVE